METVFRLKLRLANPVQRFFADAQNDNVETEWDVRRPKFRRNVSRETTGPKALLFFIRARLDFQIPPHIHATTPNARLHPPAEPADLSAHVSAIRTQIARGKRHVPLVMSESAEVREDAEPVFVSSPRVPSIPAKRSHSKNENPAMHAPRCGQLTLLTPHS